MKKLSLFITSNYEIIRHAILKRKSVSCFYNGYRRKMSPHVIGLKNGRLQALFYQYGGESSSGLSLNPSRNWRCIPIDEIQNLVINDDAFHTANNHSRPQTCVDLIDVEVDY